MDAMCEVVSCDIFNRFCGERVTTRGATTDHGRKEREEGRKKGGKQARNERTNEGRKERMEKGTNVERNEGCRRRRRKPGSSYIVFLCRPLPSSKWGLAGLESSRLGDMVCKSLCPGRIIWKPAIMLSIIDIIQITQIRFKIWNQSRFVPYRAVPLDAARRSFLKKEGIQIGWIEISLISSASRGSL
jgi:hypothetical protein